LLEENLAELLRICRYLLEAENSCILLNLYSMGYSVSIAENLISTFFPDKKIFSGELVFTDQMSRKLPLGIFSRAYDG